MTLPRSAAPGYDEPETGGEWRPELLIDLAHASGPNGITPMQMRQRLEQRGITVSEQTIYKWLGEFTKDGRLRRGDRGHYTVP